MGPFFRFKGRGSTKKRSRHGTLPSQLGVMGKKKKSRASRAVGNLTCLDHSKGENGEERHYLTRPEHPGEGGTEWPITGRREKKVVTKKRRQHHFFLRPRPKREGRPVEAVQFCPRKGEMLWKKKKRVVALILSRAIGAEKKGRAGDGYALLLASRQEGREKKSRERKFLHRPYLQHERVGKKNQHTLVLTSIRRKGELRKKTAAQAVTSVFAEEER